MLEEEKCRLKTYQDAVKSLKELQEFAVQRNDSYVLGMFIVEFSGTVCGTTLESVTCGAGM
jgi:hypothetical protein